MNLYANSCRHRSQLQSHIAQAAAGWESVETYATRHNLSGIEVDYSLLLLGI